MHAWRRTIDWDVGFTRQIPAFDKSVLDFGRFHNFMDGAFTVATHIAKAIYLAGHVIGQNTARKIPRSSLLLECAGSCTPIKCS